MRASIHRLLRVFALSCGASFVHASLAARVAALVDEQADLPACLLEVRCARGMAPPPCLACTVQRLTTSRGERRTHQVDPMRAKATRVRSGQEVAAANANRLLSTAQQVRNHAAFARPAAPLANAVRVGLRPCAVVGHGSSWIASSRGCLPCHPRSPSFAPASREPALPSSTTRSTTTTTVGPATRPPVLVSPPSPGPLRLQSAVSCSCASSCPRFSPRRRMASSTHSRGPSCAVVPLCVRMCRLVSLFAWLRRRRSANARRSLMLVAKLLQVRACVRQWLFEGACVRCLTRPTFGVSCGRTGGGDRRRLPPQGAVHGGGVQPFHHQESDAPVASVQGAQVSGFVPASRRCCGGTLAYAHASTVPLRLCSLPAHSHL